MNVTYGSAHFSMLIPSTMLRSHLKGSNMSASSLRLTKATWLLSMDCSVKEGEKGETQGRIQGEYGRETEGKVGERG